MAHQSTLHIILGSVVQLVRTLACHARGRGFEPHPSRQNNYMSDSNIAHRWFDSAPRHHDKLYAGVAQLAEQLICNQQVDGSIPFTSSKT